MSENSTYKTNKAQRNIATILEFIKFDALSTEQIVELLPIQYRTMMKYMCYMRQLGFVEIVNPGAKTPKYLSTGVFVVPVGDTQEDIEARDMREDQPIRSAPDVLPHRDPWLFALHVPYQAAA